ncbi:MAG: metallophosphoesterase [Acidimicrobiales bacterium]
MSRATLVVGALAVLAVAVPAATASAQSPVEVVARADAATDASVPTAALGRSTVLLADAAPQRVSYLRFEVPVAGASVRLRVRTSASPDAGSPGGFQVARVGAGTWTADTVNFATRPAVGAVLARSGPVERDRWVEVALVGLTVAPGPVELALLSDNADGVYFDSVETGNGPRLVVTPSPPAGPVTLWAVGDVASCATTRDEQVAGLLAGTTGPIALLGDTVYPNGTPDEFTRCFDPAWGRYRIRLRPAPGNHDYLTPGAAGYAGYFGSAAGTPGAFWYAYDAGPWRVFVLNSNCGEAGGCGPGSAQYRWLQAELAASAGRRCTLAYWHHPRFSSGQYGNDRRTEPLWQLFQDAGGDVVLSGHEHFYERFSRMTATGRWDAALGVRSFIVGTGGAELRSPRTVADGSNVRIPEAVGVLRLTLRATDYDWAFVPVGGRAPVDLGTGACR